MTLSMFLDIKITIIIIYIYNFNYCMCVYKNDRHSLKLICINTNIDSIEHYINHL